jgi:hypothetical protein
MAAEIPDITLVMSAVVQPGGRSSAWAGPAEPNNIAAAPSAQAAV